jgi:hypothetical protein
MPITSERPGVFRGQRSNHWTWYIVDPSLDVLGVTEEWRRNFAGTNQPRWKRLTKTVLFFAIWILVFVGSLVLGQFTPVNLLIGAVGFISGLALASLVAIKLFPYGVPRSARVPGVVAIPAEVQDWAVDTVAAADIWELSVAVDRLRQVASSAWYWSEGGDDVPDPYPEEIVEDVVMPALLKQWKLELKRLDELATPVGFPVPDGLREVPNPLASAPAPQS